MSVKLILVSFLIQANLALTSRETFLSDISQNETNSVIINELASFSKLTPDEVLENYLNDALDDNQARQIPVDVLMRLSRLPEMICGGQISPTEFLQENPAVKEALEEKKSEDPEFAKSMWAQLGFVYRQTPHFEKTYQLYPVGRLMKKAKLPTE